MLKGEFRVTCYLLASMGYVLSTLVCKVGLGYPVLACMSIVLLYCVCCRRDESDSVDSKAMCLLQRYSREWSEFIDVEKLCELENGDLLKVVPLPKLDKPKVVYKLDISSLSWLCRDG